MAKAKTDGKETKADVKTKPYTCLFGVMKGGKRIPRGGEVNLTDEEAAPLLDEGAVKPGDET